MSDKNNDWTGGKNIRISDKYKSIIEELIPDGKIKIGGTRPSDIKVHNPNTYKRILSQGSLGLGESYVAGWWDCNSLDRLFYILLKENLDRKAITWRVAYSAFRSKIFNLQKKSRAFQVGKIHYDIGNRLYQNMLDKRMAYSCGYWKDAKTLDEAQVAKLDLICKKIHLKKGDRVLDIGCGWGSFARYAAEKYGAQVVGITVSEEQANLARELCSGLPVEIRLQDYREVDELFDHIVSVGMFEHVGYKNYSEFMNVVHRCLKEDGFFLLHTIGSSKTSTKIDPWYDKYIFPNGMLPSIKQIAKASEGLFVVEDLHSFGNDYDLTLMAWHKNFNKNWPKLRKHYDEKFRRMWNYYLLSSAASFRARKNQLWQIVFTKNGAEQGYLSIR